MAEAPAPGSAALARARAADRPMPTPSTLERKQRSMKHSSSGTIRALSKAAIQARQLSKAGQSGKSPQEPQMLKSSSSGMLSVFARKKPVAAMPQPPAKPRQGPSSRGWRSASHAVKATTLTESMPLEHALTILEQRRLTNAPEPSVLIPDPVAVVYPGAPAPVESPPLLFQNPNADVSILELLASRATPTEQLIAQQLGRAPTASPRSVTRKRNLMDQFDGQIASREVAETPPPFGAPSSSRQRL